MVNNLPSEYTTAEGYLGSPSGGTYTDAPEVVQPPTVSSITVNSTTKTPIDDESSASDASAPLVPIITVTTQTADLSVLANDGSGNPGSDSLSYLWNCVPLSGGATSVTFPVGEYEEPINGTSAASSIVATFGSAGNYRLTVTVTEANSDDGSSLTATGVVDVTVVQTLTNIKVSSADPTPVTVAAGGSEVFFASGLDQFGNPMAVPSVAWTATNIDEADPDANPGTFDGNSYTAPTAQPVSLDVQVTATSGSISSSSPNPDAKGSNHGLNFSETISVAANTAPTVSVPASATLDPSGLTATLLALYTDAAGGSDVTYNWSVTSVPTGYSTSNVTIAAPAGQSYYNNSNAASLMVATFTSGSSAPFGTYSFSVTVANQIGQVVVPVNVTLSPVPTTITSISVARPRPAG